MLFNGIDESKNGMEFILKYSVGKWVWSCTALFDLLSHYEGERPDSKVRKAIEEFRRRYYPDERSHSSEYPWEKHRKVPVAEIKALVSERHELTWHWRLLLPSLQDFERIDRKGESIVLCVSQIRQWQLVSCFRMKKWPPANDPDKLVAHLRSAPKALLRSPVFGKSHRINRWEVYASFYAPEVLEQIRTAVDRARGNSFRLAHVLGRYDSYILVNSPRRVGLDYAAEIVQVIDIEPEQAPVEVGIVSTEDVCRPYALANVAEYAALDDDLCEVKPLLFSSDNYCRAFEQISDVLNDVNARSVLVIAPPGSGKEALSKLFHTCRPHTGKFIRLSLAGLDNQSAAFQLFHLEPAGLEGLEDRICAEGSEWCPKTDFKPRLQDGAVFKALHGTLVIDELDKASPDIRSMLLRFLESDEVTIPGTSVTLKIPDEMRPLYVFAGSMTRKEFFALGPLDFWSRITHIVEMLHPLDAGEILDRLRTAEDYIRLFWLDQINLFFKKGRLLENSVDSAAKAIDAQEDLFEPMRIRFVDCWQFFVCREVGDFVAKELAEVYCSPGRPIPSVRTLRVAASRCFNALFNALLYHRDDDAPLQVWIKEFQQEQEEKHTKVEPLSKLRDLIRIVSGNGEDDAQRKKNEGGGRRRGKKGEEERITVKQEAALSELRTLIHASANIQV